MGQGEGPLLPLDVYERRGRTRVLGKSARVAGAPATWNGCRATRQSGLRPSALVQAHPNPDGDRAKLLDDEQEDREPPLGSIHGLGPRRSTGLFVVLCETQPAGERWIYSATSARTPSPSTSSPHGQHEIQTLVRTTHTIARRDAAWPRSPSSPTGSFAPRAVKGSIKLLKCPRPDH